MNVILIERYPPAGRSIAALLEHERPKLKFCGQAYSADTGIELAAKQEPDVIILEPLIFGHMPQTIHTKITQLKRACPNAALIVTSTSDNSEHIRTMLRLGVWDYIYKPIQHQELLAALDRCCAPAVETSEDQFPEGAGSAMQAIVHYIHQGDSEAALHLLKREFRSDGRDTSYSDQCIQYMEIATLVIHLPESIDYVPEELIVLYQEFIKSSSRHNTIGDPDQAMDHFILQSASVFNRHARDQGYHQIQEAMRFVDEHLGEELSLKRLSSELYISTTYFSRLFKAKTGKKFSEYLSDRRIERAKLLLVSTDTPVMEIARQVGYTEANSFARLFKARTGQTPIQYRKQVT